MTKNKSIHVDGPGSPISIKKFLESDPDFANKEGFKVLLDQTGDGFDKEDLPLMEINDEECFRNAEWYSEHAFDGRSVPPYILKWISYFYELKMYDHCADDKTLAAYIATEEGAEEHKYICNLIKYCKKNMESKKLIGLITLWVGLLIESKYHRVPVKVLIEHPETHLHPNKTSKLMWWFHQTQKEYYPESHKDDDTEL